MNAATAPHLGRSSSFATSTLPELHRSEAFVEDLFDCSGFAPERQGGDAHQGHGRWSTALLCGLPLLVALLGGVLAFFHTGG